MNDLNPNLSLVTEPFSPRQAIDVSVLVWFAACLGFFTLLLLIIPLIPQGEASKGLLLLFLLTFAGSLLYWLRLRPSLKMSSQTEFMSDVSLEVPMIGDRL